MDAEAVDGPITHVPSHAGRKQMVKPAFFGMADGNQGLGWISIA